MVRVAQRVDPVPCATPLEARVRELRLIAEHSPRYNRRSRFPERMPWVRLTSEPYPRLSVVREVQDEDGATYIGPFASASTAQLAVDALHETFPIRQCTRRLPLVAADGRVGLRAGGDGPVRRAVHRAPGHVRTTPTSSSASAARCSPTRPRWSRRTPTGSSWLVGQERFEEAGDRPRPARRLPARRQPGAAVRARWPRCAELVAARRADDGGWELVLVRHGRLAGTARVDRRTDPRPVIATLQATGEHVRGARRARPGGAPRGDRPRPGLARAARRAARRRSTARGPTRCGRRRRSATPPPRSRPWSGRASPLAGGQLVQLVRVPGRARARRRRGATGDARADDARVIPIGIRAPRTA